jgi:hypothetical protein
MRTISWLAEELFASTKELCSMEMVHGLVGLLPGRLFIYLFIYLLTWSATYFVS